VVGSSAEFFLRLRIILKALEGLLDGVEGLFVD
jgi:hypothetical protein